VAAAGEGEEEEAEAADGFEASAGGLPEEAPLSLAGRASVPPYSGVQLAFHFAPMAAGRFLALVDVRFCSAREAEAEATGGARLWEQGQGAAAVAGGIQRDVDGARETTVAVTCVGERVPIYCQHPVLDLRCCVYGKLVRAKLVLRNRGTVALKCRWVWGCGEHVVAV
jgi:hypothetical protein